MKRKHLSLSIAALLAIGGLWFARSVWRAPSPRASETESGSKTSDRPTIPEFKTSDGTLKPDHRIRPPNPTQRFDDFTPEQRVEFARKGHGPGG